MKIKINETFAANLKNAFGKEVSNLNLLQGGGEAMMDVNYMASAIPQNEEKDIVKRKIYKSPVKKLVGNKKIDKPIGKIKSVETKEATGAAGGSGSFETALFVEPKKVDMFKDEQPKTKVKGGFVYESEEVEEKWSEKYKRSIDCDNPKGFSQKAHCQGRKKKQHTEGVEMENLSEAERTIRAKLRDIASKHASKDTEDKPKKEKIEKAYRELVKQYYKGIKVEKEHESADPKLIALDHLEEDPKYYNKLQKIEANEATGTASSGSYETTAAWAKSNSKKHWKGLSKTQIPGGKFVQVKKKCKKFPYCNQGDIKALKLFENESVQKAIKNISTKHNISENVIKNILVWEYENSRNDK